LYDAGECDRALSTIDEKRSMLGDTWSHVACLEASCHERKGQLVKGLEVLETAERAGTDNFWVYYQLGATYRAVGMGDASISAYQKAHLLAGWPESGRNGYIFTHDYFSSNIANWTKWFDNLIEAAPIKCLEIGSWQGGSSTWLLDKVVSRRGGMLTCVDTFAGSSEHVKLLDTIGGSIERIFDRNIAASGHAALCRKIVGESQNVLFRLSGEAFDFIYIDGAHEGKYVIQDAILSWNLLSPNGFILFDDLDYRFPETPEQNTIHAVESFLTWFGAELEVLHKERQMLLRRVTH
jgi:predicted O-methyltransferase YrrM